MRLLYVVNIFPRLSETFVLDQITALLDKGHDVSILSYHRPEDIVPPDDKVHEDIYLYGLQERTLYFRDQIGPIENLYGFQIGPELADTLRRADLIVAHFANTPTQVAERLSAFSGRPYIFIAHARDIFVNPDRDALRERVDHAASVVVPTEFNKQYLLALLGQEVESKIQIVRYGVNLDKFAPDRRGNVDKTPIIVLSVGRLVEKKGYPDTLRAIAQVCAEYPQVVLRIAGDGPMHLQEHVQLLGSCSHDVIQAEMQMADIFLLASCTAGDGDREGLPVAILEASAMELPVVSTHHTGISEGVLDHRTGFLVQEHDVHALAEKLTLLIRDRNLRLQMGKNGRQHIRDHYNLDIEVEKLIAIVNTISAPSPYSPSTSSL